MKRIAYILILLITVQTSIAQKGQTVAYIDMDYILENVPEYATAQSSLNDKVATWKQNLTKIERHIEILKSDLVTEKAILTKDIIEEREEEILLKEEELARLESLYFGPNGDLFQLRKRLVNPVQDQIYNAVQEIAKRKKYDFVFDKSSELVMLYFNKKYDISELVLSNIVKGRKKQNSKAKTEKKKTKQIEKKAKVNAAKKAKISKLEAQKKAVQLKREAKLKQRADKRKKLLERKNALKKKKDADKKAKKTKNNN